MSNFIEFFQFPGELLISGTEQQAQIMAMVQRDPAWIPFCTLPSSVFRFLIADTLCMPVSPETHTLFPDNRALVADSSRVVANHDTYFMPAWDRYHPCWFHPFFIKACWMSVQDGELFSAEDFAHSPLQRQNEAGDLEFLFFVHPKSEASFSPWLAEHADSLIHVPALALSSFRTFVFALPQQNGTWKYGMVKVSLDSDPSTSLPRPLLRKECGSSVMNSKILRDKLSDVVELGLFEETHSFVLPLTSSIIQGALDKDLQDEPTSPSRGVLYRPFPNELFSNNHREEYLVPCFALHGVGNAPFLKRMIEHSGLQPSQWIEQKILQPFARLYVELLYFRHISIEAHGQNLLLLLDKNYQPIKFFLRDMGGVNCLLSDAEFQALPRAFMDKSLFYSDTHFSDAAFSLENHFVARVLFNLTKQFVKSNFGTDPEFEAWKGLMQQNGLLCNWTVAGQQNDAHQRFVTKEQYLQYGYFEVVFGMALLEELERREIFSVINQKLNVLDLADSMQALRREIETNTVIKFPQEGFSSEFFMNWLNVDDHYADRFVGASPLYLSGFWFHDLVLWTYRFFMF